MAAIYHNGEESIKKGKRKLLAHYVGAILENYQKRSRFLGAIFSSIWKEMFPRFFDLYFMKMKRNFEPYIYFTLRLMLWEDIHYTRGQEYCSIFAAVWEPFEWMKAGCFGTIFLDKILFVNVSS